MRGAGPMTCCRPSGAMVIVESSGLEIPLRLEADQAQIDSSTWYCGTHARTGQADSKPRLAD